MEFGWHADELAFRHEVAKTYVSDAVRERVAERIGL